MYTEQDGFANHFPFQESGFRVARSHLGLHQKVFFRSLRAENSSRPDCRNSVVFCSPVALLTVRNCSLLLKNLLKALAVSYRKP